MQYRQKKQQLGAKRTTIGRVQCKTLNLYLIHSAYCGISHGNGPKLKLCSESNKLNGTVAPTPAMPLSMFNVQIYTVVIGYRLETEMDGD
ncbi:hypothetical protein ACVPOQ_07755 [Staphylococcus aureus]